MQIRFDDQPVLVTGAVRGIGRAICHGFSAAGARVHACDILAEGLPEVVQRAPGPGAITAHALDVTDPRAVADLVASIEREPGHPDAGGSGAHALAVVVHSAGGVLGQQRTPVEAVSPEDFQAIMSVNVNGAFNLARAAAPAMKRDARGRIIVIASRAGLAVSLTGIQAYGSAKSAQIGLVRQLASELGPHGITVNAIAPGFMRTSPDYERQWQGYGADGQRELVQRVAMRRLGEPCEIANAVLFLASQHAGFITGQVLQVTGSP